MRISDWSSDVCSSDLLVAAPFRPAGVHALQHLGPVLAFGATSARIDLDIGVVRVGLARQQRGHLVLVRPLRQRRKRRDAVVCRSEEHTSELQSLMRISYAVFCLKKKNQNIQPNKNT